MHVRTLCNGSETQPRVRCIHFVHVLSCVHCYTDVSDLHNFVNVALATSAGGEDDFANDRLSSLRTVGSGFSSLIYKLKEDIGFNELCQRSKSVSTAYKNNPNLLKMLVCI